MVNPVRGPSQAPASPPKTGSGENPPKYFGVEGLPSVTDAVLRAGSRYLEVSFMKENLILRLPFRYGAETVRYGLSRLVKNKLIEDIKKRTSTTKEWLEGLKKAVEITIGSGLIEPNLFDERLQRVGAGFLNTIARITARGGLVLSNIADKENLNLKNLLDEFVARTSARLIYSNTDNAPARIGLLTLEQLFINQWLAKMPVREYILPWLMKQEETLQPKLEKIN